MTGSRGPHQEPSRQIERAFQGAIICRGYRRTWAFPQEVAALIEEATTGESVLHLFGGRATFGMRIDADRETAPHVVVLRETRAALYPYVVASQPSSPLLDRAVAVLAQAGG